MFRFVGVSTNRDDLAAKFSVTLYNLLGGMEEFLRALNREEG